MLRWSVFLILIVSRPFSIADSKLVFSGIEGSLNSDISMQVLKEAYAEIGIDVEYMPLPGERSLRTSNAGKVDGEVFRIANVQKRYKNLLVVPTSINVLQGIVFSKTHDFRVDGWKSLEPYKIGTQVGIKFVERGTEGMNRIMVDTNQQLFRMLDSDRVDVAVVAYANGIKALSKLKLTTIRTLKPAVQEYPLYHYLHKKHADLVPLLDAELQKLHKSGRIKEIRENFIRKAESAISR